MNFAHAVGRAYRNYFVFNGRARRAEFWWFVLFCLAANLVLPLLDRTVFGNDSIAQCQRQALQVMGEDWTRSVGRFFCQASDPMLRVFTWASLLPSMTLWSRRLHDSDRSFWWFLLALVPVVGWSILLVFALRRGTMGPNRYGAEPLA